MQIVKITTAALAAAVFVGVNAEADSISLNFSENVGNQVFTGGENIGPFGSDSSNWNNTASFGAGNEAVGNLDNLIDDSGAATTADVDWASSNTWYSGSGTADDDHRMHVGYLDDGATNGAIGVNVTISEIPYAQYEVTLIYSSGQGDTYTTLDFTINGNAVLGSTATAYGNLQAANTASGSNWVELTTSQVGNYTTTAATGSSVTIQGAVRNGAERGSLAGVIITEVPEPGSLALLGLGGLAVLRRRRG